jgi:hypothetical protein
LTQEFFASLLVQSPRRSLWRNIYWRNFHKNPFSMHAFLLILPDVESLSHRWWWWRRKNSVGLRFFSLTHLCVKYFAYFCHKPQSFVCESAWISMTRLRCVRCDFKALSTRFWVEFRTHWNGIKRSHERAREDKKKPLKERKRGKFIYFFFPRRGDC